MRSSLSGSSAKRFFASARSTSSRTKGNFSATTFRISSSNAARSSGVNGLCDLEVVVEPVLDGRTEPDVRIGTQTSHGRGEDVRARMSKHVERLCVLLRQHAERGRCAEAASSGPGPRRPAFTAIASRRSRGPMDPTTSRASVPAGTRRSEPSGSERVSISSAEIETSVGIGFFTEACREAASGAARRRAPTRRRRRARAQGSPRQENGQRARVRLGRRRFAIPRCASYRTTAPYATVTNASSSRANHSRGRTPDPPAHGRRCGRGRCAAGLYLGRRVPQHGRVPRRHAGPPRWPP